MSDDALIPIAIVGIVFGAPFLWLIVTAVARYWHKVRIAEQSVLLKREMIERGYTAEEIIRVIEAGGSPRERAGRCGRHAGAW